MPPQRWSRLPPSSAALLQRIECGPGLSWHTLYCELARSSMKIGLLTVFVSFALFAQQQSKPAVVEGKIVNAATGEALRKVDVTLSTSNMPDGMEEMAAMAAQFGL